MSNSRPLTRGHILAAALGVLAGGFVVAVATRAIPTMLERVMPFAMQHMMVRTGGEGCEPEEM